MAVPEEAVVPNAENSFTLNYNQLTRVRLIRQGFVNEPILPDVRHKCMNFREFRKRRMSNYREGNNEARRDNIKGIDFLLDDEDQILTEESSGFSTFISEEEMAKRLTIKERRLWEINPDTPFPSEMKINYNPESGHASIKPAIGVSPERFVQMLNCLHWVKLYP